MEHNILIGSEVVYLKKDRFGWRVIHPVKNKNGTWNTKNFICGGSYWNLAKIGLIFIGLVLLMFSYKHDISMCENLIKCGAKCPDIINFNSSINFG